MAVVRFMAGEFDGLLKSFKKIGIHLVTLKYVDD